MELEHKHILYSEQGHVGRLILKRPPANILNIEMMREVTDVLLGVQKSLGLRALVISAEGKFFSAGVDVSEHTKDKVREMISVFHGIFDNLNRINVPTIALVAGPALGGGCELAVYCDMVLASERAKFGQPEIKVGVFPPIAAFLVPNIAPVKFASEMLLTGETYSAAEMKASGLVNKVFPEDRFQAESELFIEKVVAQSSVVLQLTKRAILAGHGKGYREAMPTIEELYLNNLMSTEDATEGLAAFMEKRKPAWKDK